MKFILKNKLTMEGLDSETTQVIKTQLTINNPKFQETQKKGRPTHGIDRELKFYEKINGGLVCPRGFSHQAYRICKTHGEDIQFIDKRRTLPPVAFDFAGELRDLQRPAVADVFSRDFGLLNAGTGAGKTVMALAIIAARKQPALVVTHTKELFNQWRNCIVTFLAIPMDEIGVIGGGKFKIGNQVTIAMVQTLYKRVHEVVPHIGHLIVDECHRAPSRVFTEAVSDFDCKYMLGLTATPWRRDGLSQVIFLYLGDVTGRIDKQDLVNNGDLCKAQVQWIETKFSPQANASECYSKAMSELTMDQARNQLIGRTVAENNGHGINLILSDRKEHCHTIQDILVGDHSIEAEVLTGATPPKERERIISDLKQGDCRYLVATGQLIGEGFDLPGISSLFLTTPVKFSGRLIQYIGRVLRPAPEKDRALIFDFVDVLNPVFEASARSRRYTYENQGIEHGTLHDE